jgi:hypothetical protein
MFTTTSRLLSITFAALFTLGMLVGIDHLAQPEATRSAAALAAALAPRA